MDAKQCTWQAWAKILHRWGLREIAATFLEAGSPLNLVFAQAIYLVQPLFAPLVSHNHLDALVSVLEDAEETHLFVNFLREGSSS